MKTWWMCELWVLCMVRLYVCVKEGVEVWWLRGQWPREAKEEREEGREGVAGEREREGERQRTLTI